VGRLAHGRRRRDRDPCLAPTAPEDHDDARAVGVLRPLAGSAVTLRAQSQSQRLPPPRIVQAGLVQNPGRAAVVPRMTVLENLELGVRPHLRARRHETMDWVFSLFPRSPSDAGSWPGTLSGGRAADCWRIAGGAHERPRSSCWTQPSLDSAPILVREVFNIIEINAAGSRPASSSRTCGRRVEIAAPGLRSGKTGSDRPVGIGA